MPLCNFLLTPALPKTLRVIKLILRGRKLPSLIRKLQHLSDLSTAVKSQGDCMQGKGLFTSVGSNFTNHSFWQWPPGLRLNPDTLPAGSQGPSHRRQQGASEQGLQAGVRSACASRGGRRDKEVVCLEDALCLVMLRRA